MRFFEESYASYSANQISRNIRVLPLPNLQYHGWVIVSAVFEVIMATTSCFAAFDGRSLQVSRR
jgi:hypothetical protein